MGPIPRRHHSLPGPPLGAVHLWIEFRPAADVVVHGVATRSPGQSRDGLDRGGDAGLLRIGSLVLGAESMSLRRQLQIRHRRGMTVLVVLALVSLALAMSYAVLRSHG